MRQIAGLTVENMGPGHYFAITTENGETVSYHVVRNEAGFAGWELSRYDAAARGGKIEPNGDTGYPTMKAAFEAAATKAKPAKTWQQVAEAKMASLLVASGEATPEQAITLLRHQRSCVVCGNGILVKWIDGFVPQNERLVWTADTKTGGRATITVHAGCLTDVSAGRRISDALGFTEPEV